MLTELTLLAEAVMSGKGDAPRNCYSEKFRDGWERAFASHSGDGGDKEIDGKNAKSAPDAGSIPATSTDHEIDWDND